MTPEQLAEYHDFTRRHGVNRGLYFVARCLLQPIFLIYLRLSRQGRKNSRIKGGTIVAANHRSFLDPFVIGCCLPWGKPMNYVAKVELFEKRWQGFILCRVGAFPIRRGEADEAAIETAETVLARGGTICIFPEGTRIRKGSLGTPKRGVGRLALRSGVPVVPVAISGSENVRNGFAIRPRKVKIRVGRPMSFPHAENPSPALAASVTSRIWPNIELQWEDIGGLPPMRRAAVIGAGSWGTAVAVLLARGGLEVQLGTRTEEQAEAISLARENERYLPGVRLPDAIEIRTSSQIELGGVDLLCLAVPSAAYPQAVGAVADRIGRRAGVLLLAKGLVAPKGQLPSEYVAERVQSRGISCLGGPAHAREAVSGSAALVLGTGDADFRTQLGDVFDRAGLVCERSEDVVGVEMSGAAKNAAVLAAAAAEPHGLNAAGIAAAAVWQECVQYAVTRGAKLNTFNGLAGVGDLLATVMAEGSRNRRAGELLGRGTAPDQVRDAIGQASEGLDSVPQIAATVNAAGCPADALQGLADLVTGDITSDEWVAALRRVGHSKRAA
ncbi:MAG TPA: 1-acyl-sn-glycerol-3-phosphate acyltransferase [Solirubrobacterales bacterium]|nr:1-acyl-sn-glycerol-3-phosphate acyltransferase [Solirubrobacterales bacterium]